jgi:hypothetical protein
MIGGGGEFFRTRSGRGLSLRTSDVGVFVYYCFLSYYNYPTKLEPWFYTGLLLCYIIINKNLFTKYPSKLEA